MTIEEIETKLGLKDHDKTIQVYFTKESGLHNLNITSDNVDYIVIKDGFLKIHDKVEPCWHCYNVNCVQHYHVPDGWRE